MNTLPVPFDVRLMNFTASVLFGAVVLGTLATGLWWALRHPVFALAGITVQGDLNHTSEVSLRTQVAPKLVGNFFTVDLRQARAAFETARPSRSCGLARCGADRGGTPRRLPAHRQRKSSRSHKQSSPSPTRVSLSR